MSEEEKTPVTIQTLAKKAGVSHTTVSRALNGSKLVKPETRKKILKLADEEGYVPNYSARRLVTKQSDIIGIFFTNIETGTSASFLMDVVEKVQQVLPDRYTLSINSIDEAMKNRKVSVQNFAGVIIISQSESDEPFIQFLIEQRIPTVVLNRSIDNNLIDNYAVNDFLGSKLATDYAIRMGHHRFALIKGIDAFASAHQRTAGFKQALAEAGIPFESVISKQGDYRPHSGNDLMRQILSSGHTPTCVICENDDMAVGAISACNDLGYKVPEDISLIGFDDMGYAKYLSPALTTVRKPTEKIVDVGVERLLRLISGNADRHRPEVKVFDPEIIVRASVKKLN